ncbi:MAG: histidine kinase [Rhodoferax sp.]|nr:histidine kinase [Rhodoferax sp.]
MLDAFTELPAGNLTSMRAELVPLDAELALVGLYLRLMQLRMGERLTFSIDTTADARAELVPPLLPQPLVEECHPPRSGMQS